MKYYDNNWLLCGMLLFMSALFSCSRMNDLHDPYLKNGEIIYTGMVDSANVFSGENRVMLRYYTSDPKAKTLLVYWNLRTESVQFEIPVKNAEDPVEVFIDNLDEGPIFFELFTLNEDMQNKSVPYNVEGNVYGSLFQQSLINRNIRNADYDSDNHSITIEWYSADSKSVGCQVKYLNRSGAFVYHSVSADESVTVIEDVSDDIEYLEYQTIFLPEPDAIDIFYAVNRKGYLMAPEERMIDKSNFRRWNPPGFPYTSYGGVWEIENLWNNTWGEGATGYAGSRDFFTFDMGQVSKITRFNVRHTLYVYNNDGASPRRFEIWGADSPNVTDDLSDWQFLGEFESIKPSGLPHNQYTAEDTYYATVQGEEFIIENCPYIRYILFQQTQCWSESWYTETQVMEMTFWGIGNYYFGNFVDNP